MKNLETPGKTGRVGRSALGALKNTMQLAKYSHILYVKPSNKIYVRSKHFTWTDALTTTTLFK